MRLTASVIACWLICIFSEFSENLVEFAWEKSFDWLYSGAIFLHRLGLRTIAWHGVLAVSHLMSLSRPQIVSPDVPLCHRGSKALLRRRSAFWRLLAQR